MNDNILEIKHLSTYFLTGEKPVRAVDDLSYSVKRGEFAAIIGESGSGKTVSALSILRLIPYPPGLIVDGSILFNGEDLLEYTDEQMRQLRGKRISMIFQEPSAALNPVMRVGDQICEAILLHDKVDKAAARKRALELLELVGIPGPEKRIDMYPYELSGGMQQRVMIAMAMSCEPDILIADEPTTALDVTVQAQVLEQLNIIRQKTGTTMIIITHNLGIVARYADSVKIMYGGKLVEQGPTREVFGNPRHPYTKGLIQAVPRLDRPRSKELFTIKGQPPDMSRVPADCCAFAERCEYETSECTRARPPEREVCPGHTCACFHMDLTAKEETANG